MFETTLTLHIAEHLAGAVAHQAELLQAERISTAEAGKWLTGLAEILTLLAGKKAVDPAPNSAEGKAEPPLAPGPGGTRQDLFEGAAKPFGAKPAGTIFTGAAAMWKEIQLRIWEDDLRREHGRDEPYDPDGEQGRPPYVAGRPAVIGGTK